MKKLKSDSGVIMTTDAMAALLILAILTPILASLWQNGIEAMKKRAVAEHFVTVQKAAFLYGQQNYAALQAASAPTTGPNITFVELQDAGCLPDRFNNQNAWGQNYLITSRRDDTGALSMIVLTTGGRGHTARQPEFANITVPETAALARAGFIPTGVIGAADVIRGAYGGWEVSLASLGLTATAGHLASVSTYSASDLDQDFLYRVAVPGQPELNAMQTSLDMTNHSIRNIQELDFAAKDYDTNFCTLPEDEGRTFLDAEVGLYLCRNGQTVLLGDSGNSTLFQTAQLAINGQLIDKPSCAPGTGTHPEILVAPAIVASGSESPVMASFQAWATSASDEQWQVHLRVLTANNEWIYPAEDYGRLVVMSTCARDPVEPPAP
ncbi:MAG: shufflon system plasmid conjugative transfer pilus tip adhesin PilV [Deltaproteobacteria bacterium]|jgi:hypothetical protein|nr:shufflon system plasmid conjugative transfer pilus tip adhesin PilV [Deltaproteobacteria bacterium]